MLRLQRVSSEMVNERRAQSVRLSGVTSDNSTSRVRKVIEELGFTDFTLQLLFDHAILTMKNESESETLIEKYGAEGGECLMNEQQRWRPKRMPPISYQGCFRCGKSGHFGRLCPGRKQSAPQPSTKPSYALVARFRQPPTK